MIKRSNDTNQGISNKSLARGQTLQTPIGKDSSDYSGSKADEVPAKFKLAGGLNNFSDTLPSDSKSD